MRNLILPTLLLSMFVCLVLGFAYNPDQNVAAELARQPCRVEIIEKCLGYQLSVTLVRVDGKEYLVNSHGGIVEHTR